MGVKLHWLERAILAAAAILLITTNVGANIAGFVIGAAGLAEIRARFVRRGGADGPLKS